MGPVHKDRWCANEILLCNTPPQNITEELQSFLQLIVSDYYNKIPQTGWLINNRHLFLMVWDAGKSKTMVLANLLSGENLIHGS